MAQHSSRPARRRAAHSKTPGPRPGYRAADRAGPDPGPDWFYFGSDHPSWPVGSEGPGWPQPGTDHPSWPAGVPGAGWAPERGGSARPAQEAPVARHHDERWQTSGRQAPVARAPVPATRSQYPARRYGAHAKTWSAQLARTQDTTTQTYYELAFGDGRLQVMLTEPPKTDEGWATGVHARPLELLQPGSEPAGPAAWEAEDLRNTDAVRVADRILSDADYQAAKIRSEASARAAAIREAAEQDAAEIRQQASAQAVPVRESAEREAAEIKKQAEAQAVAIREAAEREAAELRAHLLEMSAELGRVAAYVTESLTSPTIPITKPPAPPAAEPATAPAVKPATVPAVKPAARPGTKPATKPAARPAAEPGGAPVAKPKGRQLIVTRKTVAAAVVLVMVGAISATTEIALHGFSFFLFRNAGAGAGNSRNLQENQGPGQPGAPGVHRKADSSKPSSRPDSKPGKKQDKKPHSKPGRSN